MAPDLKVTMSARAVIARGYDFAPRGDAFADAGVALDEIQTLPDPPEPLILRVKAIGGTAAERRLVGGDWLCAASLGAPRRVQAPSWTYNYDALQWSSKRRNWLDAWEECEDARWMVYEATWIGVDRRLVVRALYACTWALTGLVSGGEDRPRNALATAMRWANGASSIDELRRAEVAALAATDTDDPVTRWLAVAALCVARAAYCVSDIYPEGSRDRSIPAAQAAAEALDAVAAALETRSGVRLGYTFRTLATTLREEIPTFSVLRRVLEDP